MKIEESLFLDLDLPVDKPRVKEALADWQTFNELLGSFNLRELYLMYNIELMQLRRSSFLDRIATKIRKEIGAAVGEYLQQLQETRKPKGVTHE